MSSHKTTTFYDSARCEGASNSSGRKPASTVSPAAPRRPALQRARLQRPSDFTLFWSGETISMFGSQVTLLALPLTAVLVLRATPAELGWVRFLGIVPYILCALVFGAWVDRRRRKPVLVLANAARAVLIGVVPLLAVLGVLTLPSLAAIAFLAGVFTVLFDVTWSAYVPSLVKPAALVNANGKLTTSSAASEVAGPGLAGILIQALSAPLALAADALSYAVAVISLLLIRTPEPTPAAADTPHLLREIGGGLRVLLDNATLRAIALMSGLWNCCNAVAETTFLLYAIRERGLSPGTLGGVIAVGAVGGLVGAAISTQVTQRGRFGPILGIAFTFGSLPWVLLPAARGPRLLQDATYALAFFLVHVGLGLWAVLTLSLKQAITPIHLLGRVNASLRLISYGLGAFGAALAGFLGMSLGLRPTLWLSAGGFIVILAITLLATPLPRVRSLPIPTGEGGHDPAGAGEDLEWSATAS